MGLLYVSLLHTYTQSITNSRHSLLLPKEILNQSSFYHLHCFQFKSKLLSSLLAWPLLYSCLWHPSSSCSQRTPTMMQSRDSHHILPIHILWAPSTSCIFMRSHVCNAPWHMLILKHSSPSWIFLLATLLVPTTLVLITAACSIVWLSDR